jgi:DnaJ-class molecular chaperone
MCSKPIVISFRKLSSLKGSLTRRPLIKAPFFVKIGNANSQRAKSDPFKWGNSGTCFACNGAGSLPCLKCGGSGSVSLKCRPCNGTGLFTLAAKPCFACQGSGKNASNEFCRRCAGSGVFKSAETKTCQKCHGTSSFKPSCNKCNGSGRISCKKCSGSGRITF